MSIERKSLPKISRRKFLIGAGLTAIAAGCKRLEKKLPVVAMEDLPSATPEPTQPPTEVPTNPPTVAPSPTEKVNENPQSPEAPTLEPSPTTDPEVAWQVHLKLWEERTWLFGGLEAGGEKELDPEALARYETFRTNVYKKIAEMDIPPKDSFLLFGQTSPWLEMGIHPDQMDESRFMALLGTPKDDEVRLYCFGENLQSQSELDLNEGCGGAKPDAQIWGQGYQLMTSGEELGKEQELFLVSKNGQAGKEDVYLPSQGALRVTDIFVPARKNEKGEYVIDEERFEQEGEKQGYLIITGQEEKSAAFLLNYSHIPQLPEGKARLKETIDAHLDIINGVIHVWSLQEIPGGNERGFYYCGNYRLETGEWVGEAEWKQYTDLFEDIPTTPEPKPTINPEEEQFYKNISRVFKFGDGQVTQTILDDLEQAKKFDPQKSELEAGRQYLGYTSAASTMIAIYYGSPQDRKPEMLKLLAQVRELARQNSNFKEEDWKIEGVDSY